MKLNSMRTMEESLSVLADNNNNNSMLLNNSGPPAWILNLRDMDLDPPKLIRGNMEVIQIQIQEYKYKYKERPFYNPR